MLMLVKKISYQLFEVNNQHFTLFRGKFKYMQTLLVKIYFKALIL